MLEHLYVGEKLEDYRSSFGADILEELAAVYHDGSMKHDQIGIRVLAAYRFGKWLKKRRVSLRNVTADCGERYLASCLSPWQIKRGLPWKHPSCCVRAGVHLAVSRLGQKYPPPMPAPTPLDIELKQFGDYRRKHRGISEGMIARYDLWLREFQEPLFERRVFRIGADILRNIIDRTTPKEASPAPAGAILPPSGVTMPPRAEKTPPPHYADPPPVADADLPILPPLDDDDLGPPATPPGTAKASAAPVTRPNGIVWTDTPARDVKYSPPSWLWEGWIQRGALNLLAGRGGSGKSFLHADLAARITCGDLAPDLKGRFGKGSVLCIIGEGGGIPTAKYRLECAGADLNNVSFLDGGTDPDTGERVRFNLGLAESLIHQYADRALVIVDSVNSFFGRTVDSFKATDVYDCLGAFQAYAETTGAAVLLVHHERKSGAGGADAIQGSTAFVDLSRVTLQILKDAEDPDLRKIWVTKINDAREPAGLAFKIVDARPHLRWSEEALTESYYDAAAALREAKEGKRQGPGRPSREREEVEAFLTEALSAGPRLARDLYAESKGICSSRTLEAVKKTLGCPAVKKTDGWWWSLPEN